MELLNTRKIGFGTRSGDGRKILYLGGKEVHIKEVAQVVPVYSMSCFKLPRGLCRHINSLIWNFCGAVRDVKGKLFRFHGKKCKTKVFWVV